MEGKPARLPAKPDGSIDVATADVAFKNGHWSGWPGRRLCSENHGPPPGRLILIHGAGVTIPTRDFGYWSSYFAGHGLAVLAFDKRAVAELRGGNADTATCEDLADDVLAGLTHLQSRSDIAADRIGILRHQQWRVHRPARGGSIPRPGCVHHRPLGLGAESG